MSCNTNDCCSSSGKTNDHNHDPFGHGGHDDCHDHSHSDDCNHNNHGNGHDHDHSHCQENHNHDHNHHKDHHGHDHDHGHHKDDHDHDHSHHKDDHDHDHSHNKDDHDHDHSHHKDDHDHDHNHHKDDHDHGNCGIGHDHNHDKKDSNDHNHGHNHSSSGDHGHGHEDKHEDDDCGCCESDGDHDHGHDHQVFEEDELKEAVAKPSAMVEVSAVAESVAITIQARVCSACNEDSEVPHAFQLTRVRVANLCCAGEERIIRSCLEGMHGVEAVTVNIVGRYAIVKHCPVDCCAPSSKIVTILNAQRLGASVQEANDNSSDEEEEGYLDWAKFAYWILVLSLFLAGVIALNVDTKNPKKYGEYNVSSLILFVLGTIFGMVNVVKGSFIALCRKTLDINILMLVAIIGAMIAAEYFDGTLLVTLFCGAELIEDAVMRTVRRAVKITTTAMAKTAVLASGKTVKVEELKINDVISVRAGDMICCDGEVVKGDGVVNESALTGESIPVSKRVGAKVFGGTIVQNGYLEIRITVSLEESAMSKLKQTVDEMQADRGKYAKMVDEFAFYWTPIVLVSALILVVVGGGVSENWTLYVNKGLVLLVLACPCAIVISAPIPSVCAIATAAKHGVLIKGSSVIERLASVSSIAVDKTGTLTKGFCKVIAKLHLSDGVDVSFDVMEVAAAVESKSTHPLANAVVSDFCGCIAEMERELPDAKRIKVLDGVGLSGQVSIDDKWLTVHVGNERLLQREDLGINSIPVQKMDQIDEFRKTYMASSVIFVFVNGNIALMLAIADEVREESKLFIQRSNAQGLSVTMLTGDHKNVAEAVCRELELDVNTNCMSRLLPQDKLAWVQHEQEVNNKNVIMIGDGINDATALSMATCGVAMGEGGAAMTITAADLVIMSDNLLRIPSSVELCRTTKQIILENIGISVAIKIAAVILAIIGMLSLWEAVLIDLGTLLLVIFNGMRPLAFKSFNDSNLDKIAAIESSKKGIWNMV